MDCDKLHDRRHDRRNSPIRMRLADSLRAKYHVLGAGVSLSMMSWGLLGGFANAAEGLPSDSETPRHPTSEIRLKSMGSTIALSPIGKSCNVVSPAAASQPHPSKIQLNPMTGDSLVTLDQPIFARAPAEHPHILSIRRLDLPTLTETPVRAADEAESHVVDRQPKTALVANLVPEMPPSILVQSLDGEIEGDTKGEIEGEMGPEGITKIANSWSNATSGANANVDDVASLPLLPLPTNQQWIAPALTGLDAKKQFKQRPHHRDRNSDGHHVSTAKISTPQTISVTRVKQLSTPHAGLSVHRESANVPARLSRLVKPAHPAKQPPNHVTSPTDDITRMMIEIGDRYPGAQVVLANADGRLVVRGNCEDRKEATAIIRMIRSHLLIPVDDQMVIR